MSRSRIISACSFTLTAATATSTSEPQVTPCGLLDSEEDVRMDTALTFIFLLRCWCVGSLPRGQSVSFSVTFSGGTLLLVDVEEAAEHDHNQHKTTGDACAFAGSGPSVQVLSSVPLSQDPGSPRLLVCLLAGLNSPLQDVLWWVDDTPVTSSDSQVSWMMSDGGGAYSATSVWEVSAADWRSRSTYWCGTVQEGRVFRQKVCGRDEDQLHPAADT
ncbi:immunoglobulin lambda-like polypeptide 1 isoform X1 [Acanthopagrus latus]|uniref:immunoglobulin lambda-like polypeptide 1 isoform X1 n=1 Tax=Acanthopagrus latus TaxID=8177 RepID=UPI00187C414C|nr:immunoglobulin lambda-like polypeptide 1 isoform X1 [Acanthopagrus latus]